MVARTEQTGAVEPVELDLSRMIGHLLRACQQLHVAIWSGVFPAGLTSPQFAVLHALAHEGPLNQTALRSRARLDRSSAADVVRRLVARRLVSQVKDSSDARRRVVRLTAAGRSVYAEATVRAAAVNETMLAGLSDAERASVLGLLQSLLEQHRGLLDYQDE
ncbi:MAG: MarR family transcriptional regulator, lower aerobic nicotinate degradation pathway regulator [Pseudonocardiales bacterium]|nr:MarR family transcriptional regulator, lower aerobic nicotinate degradation pathway regulator [Pseudonocardiales bacterium]MDT7607251.1 MarR family transcriptional regulator, lower aerobic nicotinate degradation pathway regulator [Pseudonocardiales bacterium]MDT7623733.1 MarR family transcriptional regulator, lower aerobic nicotinate degradation pathway regulator [Pseudonocardiales bacterium]MDT7637368.1 MarR family transcriptional regulator, lower aerobic nicotinate degradation pathway regul